VTDQLPRFPMVYLYDNLLWPPAQMINFALVPLQYRCDIADVVSTHQSDWRNAAWDL
jgi:hypothetical protein